MSETKEQPVPMRFDLNATDRALLRRMDQAFDEKQDYEKRLAEQNIRLAHSVQNWIIQAQQNDQKARRAHRALKLASIIGAIGWCGFWLLVGLKVFRGW